MHAPRLPVVVWYARVWPHLHMRLALHASAHSWHLTFAWASAEARLRASPRTYASVLPHLPQTMVIMVP